MTAEGPGVAPWAAAYLAAVATWALALGVARRPTLWRGRSLVFFNAAFTIVVIGTALVRGESLRYPVITFLLLLAIASLVARPLLVLLHVTRAEAEQILERCLAQTRATYERAGGSYVVRTAGEQLVITLAAGPGAIRIRFTGGRGSRKADLIRSLFQKQFSGSFPTVRLRT